MRGAQHLDSLPRSSRDAATRHQVEGALLGAVEVLEVTAEPSSQAGMTAAAARQLGISRGPPFTGTWPDGPATSS